MVDCRLYIDITDCCRTKSCLTLSRNSWFCRSGCSAVARSTAGPPPAPADIFCKYFYRELRSRERQADPPPSPAGTCMLERMDWRSDSWMAGVPAPEPAPPGAGAGTGTVAGVLEWGIENIITIGVTVKLSVCCLTCCWWCSGCCQPAVWIWCCQCLQTTSNVRIVYCFSVFSTG